MGLRGIRDFKQIPWTEQVLYGDVDLRVNKNIAAITLS